MLRIGNETKIYKHNNKKKIKGEERFHNSIFDDPSFRGSPKYAPALDFILIGF